MDREDLKRIREAQRLSIDPTDLGPEPEPEPPRPWLEIRTDSDGRVDGMTLDGNEVGRCVRSIDVEWTAAGPTVKLELAVRVRVTEVDSGS